MSVSVETIFPHQSLLEMPSSTSKHVLRRRQVDLLPMENTSFSYSGNDSMKINISSSTELLDGLDSYIKMKVAFYNSEAVPVNRRMWWDIGGCHSLFREVELRTQNGTLIQRYNYYNLWYAIMSYSTHAPQHVEVVEASAGDSFKADYVSNAGNAPSYVELNSLDDFLNATFTTATDTFAGLQGAGNSGLILNQGDRIAVNVAGVQVYYAKVASIPAAATFTVYSLANDPERTLPAANIAANAILGISVLKDGYLSQRGYVPKHALSTANPPPSTSGLTLTFKPAVSFLQQKQWIPLAFIKQGLQLELKLARPQHVLNKGFVEGPNGHVNDAELNYVIYDPRYMAMMVTVDESVMSVYLNEYNGEGIHMSILGYKHDRRSFDNSTDSLNSNFHIGVRSARHVMGVMQSSEISQAVGKTAQNSDSLSTWLDFGISKYQFKSGSEEFPFREVNCDKLNAEAFSHLMLSTNQHAGTLWCVRMQPNEFRRDGHLRLLNVAKNANNIYNNVSTKFIMSARLDRNDDNFTGLDLSLNPLDLDATLAGTTFAAGGLDLNVGQIIVHVFVAYDILCTISSNGMVIRK